MAENDYRNDFCGCRSRFPPLKWQRNNGGINKKY